MGCMVVDVELQKPALHTIQQTLLSQNSTPTVLHLNVISKHKVFARRKQDEQTPESDVTGRSFSLILFCTEINSLIEF